MKPERFFIKVRYSPEVVFVLRIWWVRVSQGPAAKNCFAGLVLLQFHSSYTSLLFPMLHRDLPSFPRHDEIRSYEAAIRDQLRQHGPHGWFTAASGLG